MSNDLDNQRQESATQQDPNLEQVVADVALNDDANKDVGLTTEPFSAIDADNVVENIEEKVAKDSFPNEQVVDLGAATVASEIHEAEHSMSFGVEDDHNLNGDDPDRVPVVPELPDDQVPNMPGAILKHAREMLGLSQREVVERLNNEAQKETDPAKRIVIRVNTISDIEHDRLNQPTAVNFVIKIIKLYANLVNIDAKALTDLYMQNVVQSQKTADINAQRISREQRRGRISLKKIVLFGVGGIVILGLGIGIGALFTSSSEEESSSGALTLSPSAQQDVVENKVDTEPFPPAVAEDPEPPLDPNTEMARAQAQALGTNDIIADVHNNELDKKAESLNSTATLSIDPQVQPKKQNTKQDNMQSKASSENLSDLLTAPEVKTHDAIAVNAEHVADGVLPTAKPVNAPINAIDAHKSQNAKQDVAPVNAQTQKSKNDKAKESEIKENKAKDNKEKEEQPTTLAASVRDISGSVRIVNRNDIGSLNTVTVKVKGPVSLRIKGNGKILKSGTYKSGDTVTATGMPPLRVEASDSSKISVRYNGGTASIPSGKNVGFNLPTR